ncbi:MAG: hypothetical protein BWY47_00422 [Bacteroidetes bacterium ADurb.Bin302]|mgnify:FL=1|jgi:hypothetical protein|nr:MAG: hypothetical protein BWY47_00422 [Bacteroidetes bacterium ADurb.Bin302]
MRIGDTKTVKNPSPTLDLSEQDAMRELRRLMKIRHNRDLTDEEDMYYRRLWAKINIYNQ